MKLRDVYGVLQCIWRSMVGCVFWTDLNCMNRWLPHSPSKKNSVLLTKSSNPPFQYISCRCYERFEINVLYHDLQYFFQHNVPKIILKHEGNIM